MSKPIALRSPATAGTDALVQSPSQEYGAPSKRARIEDRGLEVAECDIGAAQNLQHGAECRQAFRVLRQRARNDQVAGRDGGKAVRHARLKLLLDGPLRIELI